MQRIQTFLFGLPFCVAALGCSDDGGSEAPPPCNWLYDKRICGGTTGAGGDEVGDGDADADPDDGGADDGELPDACSVDGGRERTVFQCNGSLSVSIEFDTLLGDCAKTLGDPGWCDESHDFGLGFEPYDMPAVMACCDAEGAPEHEVLRMCSIDMIEQLCLSLPERLQMLIDDGLIKIGKNQAKALRKWLKNNSQECYDALNNQADTPGALEAASWLVNEGKNKDWSMLNNLTITLDEASVSTASLPEIEDEWLTCTDNDFNNTEVFEEVIPIEPGVTDVNYLSDAANASISAWVASLGRVHGTAPLASIASNCEYPRCSTLQMVLYGQEEPWTLQELSLFADGPATFPYRGLQIDVERAALRLFGLSRGEIYSIGYMVDEGDAHFLISGAILGQTPEVRWATNTTPLWFDKTPQGWTLEPFEVAHVDGQGNTWTVRVPATTWE